MRKITLKSNGQKHKTVYIPYLSDHAYILGAALRAENIPVEVLPPPDDETMAIGIQLCLGRECSPCFTTTGDIIRRSRQPGFEPAQSALFMPTAAGSCRFGQYVVLQRDILDQQGLSQLEIISPDAANSYQGFGDNPTRLRQLLWQGIVAVDLLQKLLHEYRPYELNQGQTDRVYQQCLEQIVAATQAGGGRKMVETMKWVARQFEALPINRAQPRPLIGLVGEIYLRFNSYSNQQLIRQVEAAGGEVLLASMSEWIYFANWDWKVHSRRIGLYQEFFATWLSELYQQHIERKLTKPVEHLLKHPHETPMAQLMNSLRPYYDPALSTEAVLSMGQAINMAQSGLSGILNVMPFSCMPGIITAGMAPRLRADLDNIPWLDISYDAQGGTNIKTRLEAFMYQTMQFQRRKAAVGGTLSG